MNKRAWSLAALLLGASAIPNIDIVDSVEQTGGRASSGGRAGSGDAGEPDDAAGAEPGFGGEPPGGTSGSGGTSTAGTSSTGGGGPTPAKTAFGKFCNAVIVAGQPVSLDLRVGEGANLVHIVAESGTCSPVVNRPCVPISSGSAVPVGVYDLDGQVLAAGAPRIAPGESWIFSLNYNEVNGMAELLGKSDITSEECSTTDFEGLFGTAP